MKKIYLPSLAFKGLFKKAYKTLLVFALSLSLALNSFAHRVETYSTTGCFTGQTVTVNAVIVFAGSTTNYHWQYRDNSGTWQCFINGTNATTINGVTFTVSGATGTGVNNAPTLNISRSNGIITVLDNVLIRVLMKDGVDPCTSPVSPLYGGDVNALNETKYLRLHVYAHTTDCGANTPGCIGNMLINGGNYFGGFENKVYNAVGDNYTDNNFGGSAASSDYSPVFPEPTADSYTNHSNLGTGTNQYLVINNPYYVNYNFSRNIAPHTGNFQMVVRGGSNTSLRAWYKSVTVTANTFYSFSAFAARVDNGHAPVITLKVGSTTIKTYDLSAQSVGSWYQVSGQYFATSAGTVTMSISDGSGSSSNYTLDDICFVQCTSCGALPLHNLQLRASLQGSIVGLNWTAENEMNTNQFIIERSTDGINFSQVGINPASGQTNTLTQYQSSDNIQSLMSVAVIYYRIKATDIDARFTYSNVVAVRLNKTASIQIWPSPFGDNVNISYNASVNTQIDISIINSVGKIVNRNNYSVSRGLNQLSVNNLGSLSSGIYFIRITDKNSNDIYTQKLTK